MVVRTGVKRRFKYQASVMKGLVLMKDLQSYYYGSEQCLPQASRDRITFPSFLNSRGSIISIDHSKFKCSYCSTSPIFFLWGSHNSVEVRGLQCPSRLLMNLCCLHLGKTQNYSGLQAGTNSSVRRPRRTSPAVFQSDILHYEIKFSKTEENCEIRVFPFLFV